MKKILYLFMISAMALSLGSCSENNAVSGNDLSDSKNDSQVYVVQKNENKTVSSPGDSISFEKACELLDKCSMKELELPQSAADFQKYYFGTVDYFDRSYYSVYFYTEKDDKKVFVGNNVLISCDGKLALVKKIFGQYEKLTENGYEKDKDYHTLYPDAKISPVEALQCLADKNLQTDYPLSKLVFYFGTELREIQGIPCYEVLPEVEFADSTTILQKIYITADGSNKLLKNDPDEKNEYIELE